MRKLGTILFGACLLLLITGAAQAQFATTGTTTLSVAVAPEAALQVNTTTSTLSAAGSVFANDYTGTTAFTYKVRTLKVNGTGTITLKVTTDFNAGGPSVGTAPSSGDALTYGCTVSSPGSPCSGTQTASTGSDTPVGSFGPDAKSVKAGNSGSVAWTLTNDPVYSTGSYTATVTFTISAA